MTRTTIRSEDITSGAIPETDLTPLEDDIAILGFKVAANGSLSRYELADQVIDDFQDSSGVDSSSTNDYKEGNYYVGSSARDGTGGVITYNGGNTIHQFKASGTFGNSPNITSLEYLVIAGGGSGGSGYGGGGGAGGYLTASGFSVTANTDYSITVGAGGVAADYPGTGTSGGDSTFSSITSTGGGSGGRGGDTGGNDGGSSGGGSDGGAAGSATAGQGNSGASGAGNYGGGGGGAGGTATYNGSGPGSGGAGTASSITGSSVTRAGGGGGGSASGSVNGASGGSGGGGAGGKGVDPADNNPGPTGSLGVAGTANTGSGGGGGGYDKGGDGGSGVVILKYPTVSKVVANLTLVSTSATASSQASKGDVVFTYSDAAGTASIGDGTDGDIRAYVSRDAGSTWTQATLTSEGSTGSHKILAAHDIDISSQPSGTSMRYKIETLNQSASKETRIQAVSLGWS